MKKLGLIGGTGPESTIIYYRALTQGVLERTGALPRLVIESLSVYEVLDFCRKGDLEGLTAYLVHGVQNLTAAGADCAAFTGITPHIVFDRVQAQSPIPIIGIPETKAW